MHVSQGIVDVWRNFYLNESNVVSGLDYYNSHLDSGICARDLSWSGSVTNKLTGNVKYYWGYNCTLYNDQNTNGGGGSATFAFTKGDGSCADCEGLYDSDKDYMKQPWCVLRWLRLSYDNGQTWQWYRQPQVINPRPSSSSPSISSSNGMSTSTSNTSSTSAASDPTIGLYQSFTTDYTNYPTSPVNDFNGEPLYYWNQWHVYKGSGNYTGVCLAIYDQVTQQHEYGRRCKISEYLSGRPSAYNDKTPCYSSSTSSSGNNTNSSSSSSSGGSQISSSSSSSAPKRSSSSSSNHLGSLCDCYTFTCFLGNIMNYVVRRNVPCTTNANKWVRHTDSSSSAGDGNADYWQQTICVPPGSPMPVPDDCPTFGTVSDSGSSSGGGFGMEWI